MNEQLQAIATVLSLVNPAICAMMFARAVAGRSHAKTLADATKAAVAILVILSVSALVGTQLLHLFGVSLDAFMVAGGGVLVWMGFGMIRGRSFASPATGGAAGTPAALTPLILFGASPGTITGVITVSAAHTGLAVPVTALVAVAVATTVTWAVMVLVSRMPAKPGHGSFLRDMVSRLMGLIVVAMGVQFALTGAHRFTP